MKKLHFLRYMTNVQNPMTNRVGASLRPSYAIPTLFLRYTAILLLMLVAGVSTVSGADYKYIIINNKGNKAFNYTIRGDITYSSINKEQLCVHPKAKSVLAENFRFYTTEAAAVADANGTIGTSGTDYYTEGTTISGIEGVTDNTFYVRYSLKDNPAIDINAEKAYKMQVRDRSNKWYYIVYDGSANKIKMVTAEGTTSSYLWKFDSGDPYDMYILNLQGLADNANGVFTVPNVVNTGDSNGESALSEIYYRDKITSNYNQSVSGISLQSFILTQGSDKGFNYETGWKSVWSSSFQIIGAYNAIENKPQDTGGTGSNYATPLNMAYYVCANTAADGKPLQFYRNWRVEDTKSTNVSQIKFTEVKQTYTFHIINNSGAEAVKARTASELNAGATITESMIPDIIKSPLASNYTFYSTAADAAAGSNAITRLPYPSHDVYVHYTTNGGSLDLNGGTDYYVSTNGKYLYASSTSAIEIESSITSIDNTRKWKITGNDAYQLILQNVGNSNYISYNVSSGEAVPTLSASGSKFFLHQGTNGKYELLAATTNDFSTTDYYTLGVANNTLKLYSKTNYPLGVDEVQTFFSDHDFCVKPEISFNHLNNEITISCTTAGASIYYNTDGTTPNSSSTLYNGAFVVSDGTTIKAIATKSGAEDSEVASLTIVLTPTIILEGTPCTYDGTEKEPLVSVKVGETIIDPSEYTVSYSDNTNVGTATVTITNNAGGSYYVAGSTTFTINTFNMGTGGAPVAGITITITPSGGSYTVTVTHGENTLTEGTDYDKTITEDATKVMVTIDGKGNYTGSAKAEYGKFAPGYYAIHQNGSGYLKVYGANVALGNDATFRYADLFDNNGNSIWMITADGYLKNQYYYLNVAGTTLYLSANAVTRWNLEKVGETQKLSISYDGKYLCNSGGIQLLESPDAKYIACRIELTHVSWKDATVADVTVQSPQLVTYLRGFFTQNFTYSFVDDAGTTKTESKKDRRVYATYSYKSGGSNKGSDWDIADDIIYNKKTDGKSSVDVTATYDVVPDDPFALADHPTAAEKNIKLTVRQKALKIEDKNYLLFSIKGGDNDRYPYDVDEGEGSLSANDPVKPDGQGGMGESSVLTDPVSDPNLKISWKIEVDDKGFYSFKNVKTNRYLYYDETAHASSAFGVLRVGATTLPSGDAVNQYKFRLFSTSDTDYGTCYLIIPYSQQFAVYNYNTIPSNFYATLNNADYKGQSPKVISLSKPGNSTWCIYKYEAVYRVRKDFTITAGPSMKNETGNVTFTSSQGWYGKYITESPDKGNGQRGLVINGTYNTDQINYIWTVVGLDDYINHEGWTKRDDGWEQTFVNNKSFTFNVSSLPPSIVSGTIQLKLRGGVNNQDATENPYRWQGPKTVAFTIRGNGEITFTEISSLSGITSSSGNYRLTADAAYSNDNKPGVTTFNGILDCDNHTVSGLTAPLFTTLNNGTVCNLNLSAVDISQSGMVGAIASTANGGSRIYNVGILSGSVGSTTTSGDNSEGCCGGLVGLLDGSARVINCFSYANISGGNCVGGIVGYNNYSSTSSDIRTMVMNCMFYGDIKDGSSKAPIYNGKIITNVGQNIGLGNYNYFRAEADYVQDRHIDVYNCALAAETRYLNRFEFFRHLLNSNRELAAWWATDSRYNKDEMMKWVLETADRNRQETDPDPYPYPVLKPVKDGDNYIQYPSVVNIDAQHAEPFSVDADEKKTQYNQGRKFGTLTINIENASSGAPEGASITTSTVTPNITDKDPARFNFNYYKVQLPYYNDVGTKNYTDNKVVTGWEVTVSGGKHDFSDSSSDATASVDGDGNISLDTPYNFADRKSTQKDNYATNGHRIFNQGAYFDVPEGVTSITIKPHWAKCVYVADPYFDVVYNQGMGTPYNVTTVGGGARYTNGTAYDINGSSQIVYTKFGDNDGAVKALSPSGTVYDNAIVLVGNFHSLSLSSTQKSEPFTIMSIDLDKDNEPDCSYILRFNGRARVHPVRIDFLNVIGLGMAQKSNGGTGTYNLGIMQPYGWFEVTNTGLFRVTQFEYDYADDNYKDPRENSPMILQGGMIEQWVTVGGKEQKYKAANSVTYYHVGGNVWFKEFHIGVHQDKTQDEFVSPHPPISITGGDYDNIYLTGNYNTPNANYSDNAECYINGGRFGRVAGTGMQGLGTIGGADNTGNIFWQIDNADIDEFYAGGLNAAHIAEGNIMTVISNSRVDLFCGGPKFGNMNIGKKVVTNATNCTFRTFFGAGYGGNSYNRRYPSNKDNVINLTNPTWNSWLSGNDGLQYRYSTDYNGVETRIDYQFIPRSDNTSNVARLFVDYVSFSLATTRDVTTKLTGCTLTKKELGRLKHNYCLGNFYGGGSLGKVDGPVKSTLTDCTVEGSVFGGGYSATLPTVSVMNNAFRTEPFYDENLGAYLEAELPATVTASWQHGESNYYDNTTDPEHPVLYTTATLTGLGTVVGDITLNVNGDDTKILESVYGGGQDSQVDGNTYVTVTGGTIGGVWDEEKQRYQGGAYYGNVYGGGMGKWDDETDGLVKGNTNVTISGSPFIYHNVYGGGAFGSVGTFTYDETLKIPTAATWADNTGTCNVTITGGTFGWNGQDNGMICGASRGDDEHYIYHETKDNNVIYKEAKEQVNKLAWVNKTNVIIGSSDPEDNSTLWIRGSVYGGGENGHNLRDASVKVYKGTIGIAERGEDTTYDIVSNGVTYKGPEYINRGNVYGAGCGTDYYTDASGNRIYNPMAGIVYGNTKVEMLGGHVVRCIYGAGAMGSVGTFDIDSETGKVNGMVTGYETTGKSEVSVSGGQVGTTDVKMPDDWGYVFGGGRGLTFDPKVSNVDNIQYVRETSVTISDKAFICGSVYGGAENGHVLGNTNVLIEGGQIGCGEGKTGPYKNEDFVNPLTTAITTDNSLAECEHWEFDSNPQTSKCYDIFPIEVSGSGESVSYTVKEGVQNATDGHTFYGNVFGGGSGNFPYGRRAEADLKKLLEKDTGYADGLWLRSAGWVGGNATVNITGGHILTSVYGGNECTDVDGKCTINMSGGTVGVPRTKEQIQAHPVTCYVFGAGKGDPRINFNQWTNVGSTEVKITGGIVYGSVFGGGEDGHVIGDAKMTISEESGKPTIIGSVGTSGADGNIFGGGRGFSETALTAGAVCGTVNVEIKGGTMLGSVFGGGRLASVGSHIVLVEEPHHYYGTLIPDGKKQVFGNFDDNITTNDFPEDVDESGLKHGHITVNISGGTIGSAAASTSTAVGNVFTGCKGTTNTTEPFGLSKSTKLTISSTSQEEGKMTHIYGTVYGGGEAGDVEQNVEVNINGGIIDGGVYGGGAKANTNIKWTDADGQRYDTKVNLHGGTIGSDVFGGGLGQKANAGHGLADIEAIVGGDVTVELNKGSEDDCVVKGRIFGCNNLKGTPRGNVTVHVYKTQGWGENVKGDKDNSKYELEAVYGGGNEAAYVPRDTYSYNEETGIYTYPQIADDATDKSKTNVIIDGCDLSSIEYVYGGGNSAPTPATSVTVNSCYEIGTVFGGGNGADALSDGTPNLGANVGYRNYSYYVDDGAEANPRYNVYDYDGTYPEGSPYATAATVGDRRTHYKYGTGRAETKLYGGTIHNAFGGSNTLGNVCAVAFSVIDQGNDCSLNVGQIYGAGNKAKMDARIELNLGCITGFNELFGGAFDADINENVNLKVTSGTYGSVYGGNNKGGHINGTITVEVNETGCHPVEIGSLYGGGKDADYIAPADHQDSPTVKVISATKIDKIYGGGCNADVTGNPTVEINMIPGTLYKGVSGKEAPQELGTIGTVFGGGYNGKVIGDTKVLIGTKDKDENNNPISAHITGSVYGGGENANVEGKTEVIIGKE